MHERVQIATQLVREEEGESREAAVQQMLLPRRRELEALLRQQVGTRLFPQLGADGAPVGRLS